MSLFLHLLITIGTFLSNARTASLSALTTNSSTMTPINNDCRIDDKTLIYAHKVFDMSVSLSTTICIFNNSKMEIKLTGPSNKWFGLGFNSSMMENTYTLVVYNNNSADELRLGPHTPGAKLITKMIEVKQDVIEDGYRTVIVERNIIGYDYEYYTFLTQPNILNIIYGWGPTNAYTLQGGMEGMNDDPVTIQFVEKGTIITSTMIPDDNDCRNDDKTVVSAYKMFDKSVSLSTTICVFDFGQVEITLTGPSWKWFGLGFNSSIMDGTYAIVAYNNNTVNELILGDHTPGSTLIERMITVISDTKQDGVRTIVLQRNSQGFSEEYWTFDDAPSTMNIIYGWGSNTEYTQMGGMEGMNDDPVTIEFLENGNITSTTSLPTTTMKISTTTLTPDICNGDLNTHKMLSNEYNLMITACIDLTTDMIEMFITGPNDAWFGIGFGSQKMEGTYTIVTEDSTPGINEYVLAHHAEGNKMDTSSITIINDTSSNGLRDIYVTRNRLGITNDYYTFPNISNTKIDIIWAVGSSTTYHGSSMKDYSINTLLFTNKSTSNIANTTTTIATTSETLSSQTNEGCNGILSYSSDCGDGFIIGFTLNCKKETIILSVEYSEYNDNWFGIVFNDVMTPSYSAVFTTGKSSEDTRGLGVYAYHLKDSSMDSVIYQGSDIWIKINQTINGNTVNYYYIADLEDTIWSTSTETITFRFAWGDSEVLQKHDSTSDTFTYNIVEHTVTISDDNSSLKEAHGIIMWIAWGFCASIGIMASRFRRIINKFISKRKGLWFMLHRTIQVMVVFLVITGFGIAIYFTSNNNDKHFSNSHMILGLIICILCILQPINACVRPHAVKKGENKPLPRFIWEMIHKGLGYSIWIMSLINIYLGIILLDDDSTYGYAQIGWIIFICIIYVSLWLYDYFVLDIKKDVDVGLLDNEVERLSISHQKQTGGSIDYTVDEDDDDNVVNDKNTTILNNEPQDNAYKLLENEKL